MSRKPMKLNLKKGALHKALGIPTRKKIPTSDLQNKPGDTGLMKKRKNFARMAKTWNH